MKKIIAAMLATVVLGFASAANAAPRVVTSVKPINSLVASVMQGVATPYLLVKGGGSPHTYAMRPSDASELQGADLVFWVGPDLELFLNTPLDALASDARVEALGDAPGIVHLPLREGGAFEEDDHDHVHADHEDNDAHDADHDHADNDALAHADHEISDAHIWLNPENAKAMVLQIATTLKEIDPDNASTYDLNADKTLEKLAALSQQVERMLDPVRGKPFVVFHDAYQYFEKAFGIEAVGSITVSPDAIPGAQRVAEVQNKLSTLGAACVFAEPQFEPKLINVVIEGTEARSGTLDPLGADLPDGPELYFDLVRGLAKSLVDCLNN